VIIVILHCVHVLSLPVPIAVREARRSGVPKLSFYEITEINLLINYRN